jgi:aspartate/methionine/tyrosine aminotransferase
MKINPFQMERWQSTWENRVSFNLSESGVHPMTPGELFQLAEADAQQLINQRLIYNQSNGTDELRERVAAIYPGATFENVLVANGGSEANYVSTWKLLEPGDAVVMQAPNYMQMWGTAQAFADEVRSFNLLEDRGWAPDLDQLSDRVDDSVKLIIVTNPNNPTPDGRDPQRGGGGFHRLHRRPRRRLDHLRRDLRRRRAGRPMVAQLLGPLR